MFCMKARKLIIPYSEGALDERKSGAVARHIATCPKCAEELAFVEKAGAAMRESKTPALEPASNIWARIEREITSPASAPVQVSRQWRVRGIHLAGAAAAAAVVLIVVISDSNLTNRPEPAPPVASKTAKAPSPGAPAPDSRPTLGASKETDAISASIPATTSAANNRPHRAHHWKRPVIAKVNNIETPAPVPPPSSDDIAPVEIADAHAAMSRSTATESRDVRAAGMYDLDAATPSGAPVEAPRPENRSSSHTSVDLMNNADNGSRVSALFSYP